MEWMDKILRLNKGEQNRHGEIEYEYPLEERIQLLSDILNESNLDGLTSNEKSELQSAIYWGLCGSINQIEKFSTNIFFIKPLLAISKQQILDYLNQKNIKYSLDTTNLENICTRNILRNKFF